ncbi:hypothetical protein EJB05_36078, partial [Eragrostis curvula]
MRGRLLPILLLGLSLLAYGLGQCRGDVNASDCHACLDAAVRDVASKCPGQRSAMVIYEACQLLYSDESFFAVFNKTFSFSSFSSCDATWGTVLHYNDQLFHLMKDLTEKAAYGTPRMFAVGAVQTTPSLKLYAMAQCTQEITADDCDGCLSGISSTSCTSSTKPRQLRRPCHLLLRRHEAPLSILPGDLPVTLTQRSMFDEDSRKFYTNSSPSNKAFNSSEPYAKKKT